MNLIVFFFFCYEDDGDEEGIAEAPDGENNMNDMGEKIGYDSNDIKNIGLSVEQTRI